MTVRVFCVVEGHGDVAALPITIRRIAGEIFDEYDIDIERPYRLPKDKIMSKADLQPILEFGMARLSERSEAGDKLLVLVTRDADEDCPVKVAHAIADLAVGTSAEPAVRVAIPNEEFESWFLAGAEGMVGHRDCREEFAIPANSDAQRSPKGLFERTILRDDRSYSETVDQPKFAALMTLTEVAQARSRSLRHLVGVIGQVIAA